MAPTPISCDTDLPDGSKCKELVTVTKTQYFYNRKPLVGRDPDYALKEIHYTAVCPTCGERTVVEVHRGSEA
jgi:hypothetical protein